MNSLKSEKHDLRLAVMIFLRVIFIAQLVLMLPAFAYLLLTPVQLGTVAVIFYLVPFGTHKYANFANRLFIRRQKANAVQLLVYRPIG